MEMKNNRRFIRSRQKSYLTAGVIALAAIIAMGGLYYKNLQKENQQQIQLAQTKDIVTEPKEQEEEPETVETMAEDQSATKETAKEPETKETASYTEEKETVKTKEASNAAETAKAKEKKEELTFSKSTKIAWPVKGNVLLNYSMDKTIYFATLDQYKYNPALIIQAQVNTKVQAASDGRVTDVSTNENTGMTLTVDIGSGYTAQYGQLKEVKLKKGDEIKKGDVIGYITEPTKYYSVEGSNLYFAMMKDKEPVDPMDFLE